MLIIALSELQWTTRKSDLTLRPTSNQAIVAKLMLRRPMS